MLYMIDGTESILQEKLKSTFVDSVSTNFEFLIDLGYTLSDVETDHSDLVGDSFVLHLQNPERNRDVYFSISTEGSEEYPRFVYISIHRRGKSKDFGDNNIVFNILCKHKEIKLKSVNEMRKLNEEAIENLKVILKEYATVLKIHFLPIFKGEEWIEGMYTPWR